MGIIIKSKCENWFLILLELGWFVAIGKNVYDLAVSPPEMRGINAVGTVAAAGLGYLIIKGLEGPICAR